jgi:hypothetical protein
MLEHYDAVGRWTMVADGNPVNASAEAPLGGEWVELSGARDLAYALADDEVVRHCVAEQFLQFVFGGGMGAEADPVREVLRGRMAGRDADLLEAFRSLPLSSAFQFRKRKGTP